MSYIYKITNILNDKIYIGKTNSTIEQRWKQHCSDRKRTRCEKRPLYDAMNKYGIENFTIEEVEQCSPEEASEREKYWIEYYGSFKNGYNATSGGDGKSYLDYDLIIKTYNEIQNQTKVAELLNVDVNSIRNILRNYNIPIKSSPELAKETFSKSIIMFSKNDEELQVFASLSDAARFIIKEGKSTDSIKGVVTHIGNVAKGKRQTAYGYKWKYLVQ